ncbi:MAG: glycosyltransferase [Candidatus Omnitrophota bacterium]
MNEVKKPVVCFGMTLYNNAAFLREAMDSLLSQTYNDFYLVAVDDCSTDDTQHIMREYATKDPRVKYFRNPTWSGMIATWRAAFFQAYDLYAPDYFAWVSDHDRWHPEWLANHVQILNEHKDVVLTYGMTVPISASGGALKLSIPPNLETVGMDKLQRIFEVSTKRYSAGNAIYGLFRAEALKKAGVFRWVINPDKLVLTEISVHGTIKTINEELWYRRYTGQIRSRDEDIESQRNKLFGPIPPPYHTYCPYTTRLICFLLFFCIMPEADDYSNFWAGLALAGLYWEKYGKDYIAPELIALQSLYPEVSGYLSQSNFSPFPDLYLKITEIVNRLIRDLAGETEAKKIDPIKLSQLIGFGLLFYREHSQHDANPLILLKRKFNKKSTPSETWEYEIEKLVEKLSSKLEMAHQERGQLRKKVTELESQLIAARAEIRGNRLEIERNKELAERFKERYEKNEAKITAEFQIELEHSHARMQTIQVELDRYKALSLELQDKYEARQERVEHLKAQVKTLQSKLGNVKEKSGHLNEKYERAQTLVAQLKDQLEKTEHKFERSLEESEYLKGYIENLRVNSSDTTRASATTKLELEQYKLFTEKFRDKFEKNQATIDQLKDQLKTTQSTMETERAELLRQLEFWKAEAQLGITAKIMAKLKKPNKPRPDETEN